MGFSGRSVLRSIWCWGSCLVEQAAGFSLARAVARSSGCVPHGAQRGTTRRNSQAIATRCNDAGRRAGRALASVAGFSERVPSELLQNVRGLEALHVSGSGQLLFLGSGIGRTLDCLQTKRGYFVESVLAHFCVLRDSRPARTPTNKVMGLRRSGDKAKGDRPTQVLLAYTTRPALF